MRIHFDMIIQTPKISCYVRERFMYNFDVSKTGFLKCQIVGATQYKGQVLTFHALVDGKWMYSDLPIHAFCRNKKFESPWRRTKINLSVICLTGVPINFQMPTGIGSFL